MTIREEKEKIEEQMLSPFASISSRSQGRDRHEDPCDIRTCYQRDRDRIIHCKSFRRLKHKTQVFLAPAGDHYRTRLTHTLEVSQIARTIATCLKLNEDLTEAIALGHDLGHTPYGHAGERALRKRVHFDHAEQSVRIVEKLERDGEGLNLCKEVRDGIANHGTSAMPATLEGRIVRFSDKIAYVNHDVDDALRAGILKEDDIPKEIRSALGATRADRLDFLIKNIISNSLGKDDIIMDADVFEAFMDLRKFLFDFLYTNPVCKSEEIKADAMLLQIYDYYMEHPRELPEENLMIMEKYNESYESAVCDYISGMTDSYSVTVFEGLFIPRPWGL
ncbi:MAG: deoxyguanosinetriphosphate triphosphohydrolase [Parasporobacterium sp.]|nr:deoxyguanosinetriphosphate triphosphohydrolase [Parasporobacterium sp.]